jgi:hypothetical protein
VAAAAGWKVFLTMHSVARADMAGHIEFLQQLLRP